MCSMPTLNRMPPGATPAALFLRRHLPMRGRRRMAGKRFRVAQIHQPLEQFEGVVETHAAGKAAADFESQQRASAARPGISAPADSRDCPESPHNSPIPRADWHAKTRRP